MDRSASRHIVRRIPCSRRGTAPGSRPSQNAIAASRYALARSAGARPRPPATSRATASAHCSVEIVSSTSVSSKSKKIARNTTLSLRARRAASLDSDLPKRAGPPTNEIDRRAQYRRKTMTHVGTLLAWRGKTCALTGSLTLIIAAFVSGCGQHQGQGGGPPGGFSFPVSAAPIKHGPIDQTTNVTGTVAPIQRATLSSVISGTVLTVNGQIGQHVSRGDLLVKIDDSTLQAQLREDEALTVSAQARYDSAKANASGTMSSADAGLMSARSAADSANATLKRDLALFKQGYVSQQAVDQQRAAAAAANAALSAAEVGAANANLSGTASSALADLRNAKAAVDSAQAASSLAQAQIAQTNVRAPFDGVIVFRAVDPGALAAPGTPLMEVDQLDPIYVDV